MKKLLIAPAAAGALLLGTAAVADARDVQTTPPVDAVSTNDDDGGSDSRAGLLGLLGLLGLAGLAGLKRREPDVRPDIRTPLR